ncbi:MAG: VWA domain-containing protein [Anaerolineales bacterium]|jgi:hypothetical protein
MRDWTEELIRRSTNAIRKVIHSRHASPPGARSLQRSRNSRSGQSLIIIAVAFIGIVAFIGFAVDTGIMYLHRVWLGQAIDAAALAAGYELPDIEGACSRAVEYLGTNGYVEGDEFHFQIVFTADEHAPGGPVGEFALDSDIDNLTTPEDCTTMTVPSEHVNTHYHVRIAGELTVPVVFMRVLGFETIQVGTPATAKRTAQYDVALVLDVSGSMNYDSCTWLTDEPEYTEPYACENVHSECSAAFGEVDFDGYADIDAMIADGWDINSTDAVEFQPLNGHDNAGVHIYEDPATGTEGSLSWQWNVTIPADERLAVYFWVKNDPAYKMDAYSWSGDHSADYARLAWRASPTDGWSTVMGIEGGNAFDTGWEQYAVVIDTDEITDYVELRWEVEDTESNEGYMLDDITLRTCPFQRGPSITWQSGCSGSNPKSCDDEQPGTLLPGESVGPNEVPRPRLLSQPMTDVIRGAETFVNIIRDRADDSGMPREDQIGLAKYERWASKVLDLTIDYETIVETMYTSLSANGYTNIGGGMRVGLSILGDGRPNTTHFMILLTDGVLNTYDYPYDGLGSTGVYGGTACSRCLEYVDAMIAEAQDQNVIIFTIGLGSDVVNDTFSAYGDPNYTGMKLMERIATLTNGQSYFAPTSEELEEIFEWIAEAIFVRLTL